MKENRQPVLMYGDRVRFHWVDADYGQCNTELTVHGEYDLEGLYAGVYECSHDMQGDLAIVTVTTKGEFYTRVLHPRVSDLVLVEHPSVQPVEETPRRGYDQITLMQMADNIMDNFDFHRVAITMEALHWTWASCDPEEDGEVPDERRIRREARKLLNQLIQSIGAEDETAGLETGGFGAYFTEEDGIPNIQLRFIVSDWDEGYDCWECEYQKDFENRKKKGAKGLPIRKTEK